MTDLCHQHHIFDENVCLSVHVFKLCFGFLVSQKKACPPVQLGNDYENFRFKSQNHTHAPKNRDLCNGGAPRTHVANARPQD